METSLAKQIQKMRLISIAFVIKASREMDCCARMLMSDSSRPILVASTQFALIPWAHILAAA